jgi:hypothetical protein
MVSGIKCHVSRATYQVEDRRTENLQPVTCNLQPIYEILDGIPPPVTLFVIPPERWQGRIIFIAGTMLETRSEKLQSKDQV